MRPALSPLHLVKRLLRITRTALGVAQKPLYSLLLDKTLADALDKGAAKYDTQFTPKERFFLQRAFAGPDYSAQARSVSPAKAKGPEPDVTFVILDTAGWSALNRCLFVLAKQPVRIQLIVVGGMKNPLAGPISSLRDLTWITAPDVSHSTFHTLATPHIRGRFVSFLRSSDIVHPSFFASLAHCHAQFPGCLALGRAANGSEPLPGIVPPDAALSPHSPEEDMRRNDGLFSRLNDALFHSLFDAALWKTVVAEVLPKDAAPFAALLHTLAYARRAKHIVRCPEPLVKETPARYSYTELCRFTRSLQYSLKALERELDALFGAENAAGMISALISGGISYAVSRRLNRQYGPLKASIPYSHLAFYTADCIRRQPEEAREIMARNFAAANFGRFMGSPRVHAVHHARILLADVKPDGITLYDEQGLPDLQYHLRDFLRGKYRVQCLEKSSFVAFRQLELMAYAVLVSETVLIISSILVHRAMNADRCVIQAWHGCGFIKKAAPADSGSVFAQDYMLASSQDCLKEYPAIYGVSAEKLLPFGSLQTDRYFVQAERDAAKARVYAEFPDLAGKRLCFFAPTFRQYARQGGYAKAPYYFCGWDFERMDSALAESGTVIVFKRHQKLHNAASNMGANNCDLQDSPGGWIRETHSDCLFDWVCACDLFMTDYSSAMIYAMLLNKPVLFYAPDLDDYIHKANGFYIDFPATAPGPIVQGNEPSDILRGMEEAGKMVHGERYAAFRQRHAGSCDGSAARRLADFLQTQYPLELQRLSGKPPLV